MLSLIVLGALAQSGANERKVDTVVKAVDWENSLDALKARAAKSRKPIFWLNIVGQLDEET
jgi:hypothetical protein